MVTGTREGGATLLTPFTSCEAFQQLKLQRAKQGSEGDVRKFTNNVIGNLFPLELDTVQIDLIKQQNKSSCYDTSYLGNTTEKSNKSLPSANVDYLQTSEKDSAHGENNYALANFKINGKLLQVN